MVHNLPKTLTFLTLMFFTPAYSSVEGGKTKEEVILSAIWMGSSSMLSLAESLSFVYSCLYSQGKEAFSGSSLSWFLSFSRGAACDACLCFLLKCAFREVLDEAM